MQEGESEAGGVPGTDGGSEMKYQPTLFDNPPLPPARKGEATQQEAARHIAPVVGELQAKVLGFIKSQGSATNEELSEGLGMKIQTVCGRVAELREMGKIKDSSARRKTRAGVSAKVWVAIG